MPTTASDRKSHVKYMVEVYVLYRNNTWKFRHIEISKGLYDSFSDDPAESNSIDHELFDMIYASDICSVKVRSKYIMGDK